MFIMDTLNSLGGSLSDVVAQCVTGTTTTVNTMLRSTRRRSLSESDLTSLLRPDFTLAEVDTELLSTGGKEICSEELAQPLPDGLDGRERIGLSSGSFLRVKDRSYAVRARGGAEASETGSSLGHFQPETDSGVEAGAQGSAGKLRSGDSSQLPAPPDRHRPPPRVSKKDWSTVEERRNHHAFLTSLALPSSYKDFYEAEDHPDLQRAIFWHGLRRKSLSMNEAAVILPQDVSSRLADARAIRKLQLGKSMPNLRKQTPAVLSHHHHHRHHHSRSHGGSHKHDQDRDYAEAAMVSAEANKMHREELARLDNAISGEHKRLVAEQVHPVGPGPLACHKHGR